MAATKLHFNLGPSYFSFHLYFFNQGKSVQNTTTTGTQLLSTVTLALETSQSFRQVYVAMIYDISYSYKSGYK